jgi:hypothetical protein
MKNRSVTLLGQTLYLLFQCLVPDVLYDSRVHHDIRRQTVSSEPFRDAYRALKLTLDISRTDNKLMDHY